MKRDVVRDWPKPVKIACFLVPILRWPRKESADAQRFAEFSALEQTIRVDEDIVPGKMLDTVLHELNHAVFWAYGIEDGDKEERVVGLLGTAWAAIFLDNPHLVDWIKRETKRMRA
jgi:hypothetical protein